MNPEPAHPEHQHHTPTPPTHTPVAHHTAHTTTDYPSSPIETAKQGVRALWQNGRQALAGVVVIGTILSLLTTGIIVLGILALIAAVYFNLPQADAASGVAAISALTAQMPPQVVDYLSGIAITPNAAVIIAFLAVATVLLGAFMQALGLAYIGIAVVRKQTAHLGEIMRLALKRTLPLLVQFVIMTLVVFGLFALPVLIFGQGNSFAQPSGAMALGFGLYVMILFILLLTFGLRFIFAPLGVVIDNLGPVQAIRNSFYITKGHLWEIIGVLSLTVIGFLVIDLVLTPLRTAAWDNVSVTLLWVVVEMILSTILGFVVLAIVTERFAQFRKAAESQTPHKSNVGLNAGVAVAAIIVAIVVGSIQNSLRPASTSPLLDDVNNDSVEYLDSEGNPLLESNPDGTYDFDSLPPEDSLSDPSLDQLDQYDYNYQ